MRSEMSAASHEHQQALILQADGKLALAEDFCQAALRIKRAEERDTEMAGILNTLASIRLDLGDATEARRDAICAVEILADRGDPGKDAEADRLRVRSLCLIARSHMQMHEYDQARPLLERALTLAGFCLEEESAEQCHVLLLLGKLCHQAGHWHEAHEYYLRALHMAEQTFDAYHGEVANACHHLAQLAEGWAKPEDLHPYARLGYEIRSSIFGSTHPLTAAAQGGWAMVLEQMGDTRDANDKYLHALAIFDRHFAGEQCELSVNPELLRDYAVCLRGATRHLIAEGRGADACEFSERAQQVFERVLGKRHPFVKQCRREHQALLRSTPRGRRHSRYSAWEWWRSFSFIR
ncbi:MAG: tetratricopeptide repeat protein [Acidobacteria bacterium]|nr:tetratricopeptide repeat protein [Acidobacteriota bacterium]